MDTIVGVWTAYLCLRHRLVDGAPHRGDGIGIPRPADRRWWHVELGDGAASWTMDVRVNEITGVRFVREPYPFPSFPGRETLTVQFLGPGGDTVLSCYVHELYDGQRMRPEKLAAWQALRERYGNRDESRVERGSLLARPPEPLRGYFWWPDVAWKRNSTQSRFNSTFALS
jgi:hypothetical protein